MNTNKSYKYINLLLRIAIGFFALYFIYTRLNDDLFPGLKLFTPFSIHYIYLLIAFLLLLLNWGFEAIKWKYAIRLSYEISFFNAFKTVLTGLTLGFLTPNRIGEIPGRAFLLRKSNFKEITLKTAVASFSQLLITLFFGTIGLFYSYSYFNTIPHFHFILLIIVLVLVFLFFIYFQLNILKYLSNYIHYFKENDTLKGLFEFTKAELLMLLFYSCLRYLIFSLQYYLVLYAFGISLSTLSALFLIPICFMIASFLPTIFISEIGVRGSVALFIFGFVSELDVQIVLASVVLWFINIAIPVLLGLFNLKDIKMFQEK
jgi:uncharacterized membrane protein YbhN (UPF0104 family)